MVVNIVYEMGLIVGYCRILNWWWFDGLLLGFVWFWLFAFCFFGGCMFDSGCLLCCLLMCLLIVLPYGLVCLGLCFGCVSCLVIGLLR